MDRKDVGILEKVSKMDIVSYVTITTAALSIFVSGIILYKIGSIVDDNEKILNKFKDLKDDITSYEASMNNIILKLSSQEKELQRLRKQVKIIRSHNDNSNTPNINNNLETQKYNTNNYSNIQDSINKISDYNSDKIIDVGYNM